MTSVDAFREISDWHSSLMRRRLSSEEEASAIEERLSGENDPDKRYELRCYLAGALAWVGRIDETEALYLSLHAERPAKPRNLISLAESFLYAADQPERALPVIDQAIEVAFRSGDFRRNALGVKGRIALALKRYDLVEEVMRQIIPLRTARGRCDCGMEDDILDRLPPGTIDEEVRREYAELCRRFEAWVAAGRPRLTQGEQGPSS